MAILPNLFFKKIRPAGSGFEYHDLTCELVCARLAAELSLPVPSSCPVTIPGRGLGIVSALAGLDTISDAKVESIVNADKLPAMFVFEQLVMNVDDKADHFRLKPLVSGGYEFHIVDHGHTLHAWRPELQDLGILEAMPALLAPSSTTNEYRVRSYSRLSSYTGPMSSQVLQVVEKVVETAFFDLGELRLTDAGLDRFLFEGPKHAAIISTILRRRANGLEEIVKHKCRLIGIPTDLERNPVAMAGVLG
jgi:hypothetical protein